ncbi:Uncharacterised protein [Acinetobacter baumannii]|nr:Uncharacterised protein [Acinetobacter baumannii]
MRFLRILFAAVLIRRLRQIFIAEVVADVATHHVERILAQVGGVGTHIGDVTGFIQPLRHHHGFLHAEAQAGAGGLLQRGGNERRARLAAGRFVFAIQHRVAGFFQQLDRGVRLLAVDRLERFVVCVGHFHLQRGFTLRQQIGMQLPVLFRHERLDVAFAFYHQTHRHRLHAAGGQAAGDFLPQQRRDHIAHHAVHKPARLLRVDAVNVQLARLFERLLDRVFGDFVKHHAAKAFVIPTDHFPQVPGDGFPFAVKVGCEINVVGVFRQRF